MNLDRRQLALPVLAIGLLGVLPAFAGADEDAVAKDVEAFRAAQLAADAKALDGLCAAELSYSHSDARIEDKATFIANATDKKTKFLSLAYQDVSIRVVGPAAIVRFHWVGESEAAADGKEKRHQSPRPDELAKARRGLEAAVARVDEVVMLSVEQ